ncbi:MAG: NAD-dependent epimerase/dehydratase family protein [Streptosporangiaceae bacterium]
MAERVAVSGSAGFIGGYVTTELLRRGYQVIGVDNFSKYGPRPSPHDGNPAYSFVEADAADAGNMTSLLAGCDQFIAAAAMIGGISYFHAYPYDLLAANARIMAASCDAAVAAHRGGQLRKLTFVSSSMVYESAARWPSAEGQQHLIPPPQSAYGFSKLAGEYLVRAAFEQYGLPFTIVRPFNCVGAGECQLPRAPGGNSGDLRPPLSHVVPDLVIKLLRGQDPLRILGSGRQLRHFTYAGDVARGIVTAMEHPLAVGEDFNLSTAQATSVLELAALIWAKVKGPDVPLRIVHDPPFRHDVQQRIPDTGKAKRLLGFEASTCLDQMLDEVIDALTEVAAAGPA